MPKYTTRICPNCGNEFQIGTSPSILKNRKYCSRDCATKASYSHKSIELDWVDIDATIEKFGHSPLEVEPFSNMLLVAICQKCFSRRDVAVRNLTKLCRNCANGIISKKRDHSSFTLLPTYIDIQATIKQFGYDPCFLSKGSQKKVVTHCYICGTIRIVKMQAAMKYPACLNCSYNDPMSKENRSNAQKEVQKRRGKWNMSNEAKAKISKSRILQIAQKGINHGKGEWYYRNNKTKVYLRSSYEIGFAQFLDASDIDWEYEPKAFMMEIVYRGENKTTSYRPDFYLPEYGRYIEVKGYWYDLAKVKFQAFLSQYPEIEIDVYEKPLLQLIGAIE